MLGDEEIKGQDFSTATVLWSAIAHILFFASITLLCVFLNMKPETVIPIEFMVVTEENLEEDEPEPPKPAPEPPKPEPPKPTPPKPAPKIEETKQEAVVKVPQKPTPPKPEPPKPKPQPPKEKPKPAFVKGSRVTRTTPQKTVAKPSAGPKTEKKLSPDEIRRLLAAGAKTGPRNQIPPNDQSRCMGEIYNAFYRAWNQPPAWRAGLQPIIVAIRFGAGGVVSKYHIVQKSGDDSVDQTVYRAVNAVKQVYGLTADFLRAYPEVEVVFELNNK